MKTHELKTWPDPFQAVWDGAKTYEIRTNDREFKVGDLLHLREYDPATGSYTGSFLMRAVSYMTLGGEWGLPPGLCVLGLASPGIALNNGSRISIASPPPDERLRGIPPDFVPRAEVEKEREECAQIVSGIAKIDKSDGSREFAAGFDHGWETAAKFAAECLRARSKT